MKIQFDFSKHRNSPYLNLLADYIHRLTEFAKLGAFKGECLDLCFVIGLNDKETKFSKSGARRSCHDVFSERSHLSPLDITSEELSELIQKSLTGGISNIRVTVKKMADWQKETAGASARNAAEILSPSRATSFCAASSRSAPSCAVLSGGAPFDTVSSGAAPCGIAHSEVTSFEITPSEITPSEITPSGTVYISLLRCKIGTDLAEVLAAEQIYRAFMIFHNRKYHK